MRSRCKEALLARAQRRRPGRSTLPLLASLAALLAGCVATAPKLGENKGTVSGAAGGASAENANSKLEKCAETLGTLAMQEDTNAPGMHNCAASS